eukprot:scaffold9770_cov110-Isochrysis_galbana.AAC.7
MHRRCGAPCRCAGHKTAGGAAQWRPHAGSRGGGANRSGCGGCGILAASFPPLGSFTAPTDTSPVPPPQGIRGPAQAPRLGHLPAVSAGLRPHRQLLRHALVPARRARQGRAGLPHLRLEAPAAVRGLPAPVPIPVLVPPVRGHGRAAQTSRGHVAAAPPRRRGGCVRQGQGRGTGDWQAVLLRQGRLAHTRCAASCALRRGVFTPGQTSPFPRDNQNTDGEGPGEVFKCGGGQDCSAPPPRACEA